MRSRLHLIYEEKRAGGPETPLEEKCAGAMVEYGRDIQMHTSQGRRKAPSGSTHTKRLRKA